jgi:exopolysaccharide biosynthesis operon protein EpsL
MTRRVHFAPGLVIVLALWSAHALAQEEELDALKFSASQSVRYDSNLFRRNTDVQSETVNITTATMAIDKRYSLQRFELGGSVVANRYRANENLNFNALNYRAIWHWSVTPRVHGTLSRTRREDINTFDVYREFDRNIRTETATAAAAEYELGRDWRLLAGLTRRHRENERPTAQDGDSKQTNVALGVRRLFPSGSFVSYRLLDGHGDYYNRVPGVSQAPTEFDQTEHEVQLSWSVTEKTRLTGTLSYLKRDHPGFPARNYSGPRGNLTAQWSATGKVGVQLRLARDISTYTANNASYTTVTNLSVSPYWLVGARTTLFASLQHGKQGFGGSLIGFTEEDRDDRNRLGLLGVRWQPIDALTLDASLAHEQRRSSLDVYNYTNRTARFDAKFAF